MTALDIIPLALAIGSTFAALVFGTQRRRDEETITGLRDQLHAESEVAAYWYDAAHGLTWTTRDGDRIGFHQSHGEHLAAALDRAEWPGDAR